MQKLICRTISLPIAFASGSSGWSSLRGAAAAPDVSKGWMPLGGSPHHVAKNEGNQIGDLWVSSPFECESACDGLESCKSFAFCGGHCFLKDKSIQAGALYHHDDHCSTYYKPSEAACYQLFSNMEYNSLMQYYPNNPDSHAEGYTYCTACTNGTIWCNSAVWNGMTPLIASHIHLAKDGNGVAGSGDPVISFCGDNTPGMINEAGPYQEPCVPYMNSRSNNKHMLPYFILGTNGGMTMAERVQDIINYPSKYYFNFHSKASWAYWSMQDPPTPVGTCRGVLTVRS